MTRAAEILIQVLIAHDVDRIFCVPRESYLAVGGPAVIEVPTSLEYISAYAKMSELSPGS